jgi:hypothetical protein
MSCGAALGTGDLKASSMKAYPATTRPGRFEQAHQPLAEQSVRIDQQGRDRFHRYAPSREAEREKTMGCRAGQ